MLESIKGWKTILFNIIMTVVMLISVWGGFGDAPAPTGEDIQSAIDQLDAAIAAIWGIGNLILRAITNTSIFKRE